MGEHILNSRLQDDFGNMFCRFVPTCIDDFGNLRGAFVWGDWLDARDYFYRGEA